MRAIALAPLFAAAFLVAACGPNSNHECTPCGDNACADTSSDTENCGGCGITCIGTQVCVAGECTADPGETCDPGDSEACYDGAAGTDGVGACVGGTRTCSDNGYWGQCEGQVVPRGEVCSNGGDEDCDSRTDEETDNDGDGFTNCTGDCCDANTEGCSAPERVNPGAFEAAGNNVDDDCDGTVDNAADATCDSALASDTAVPMDFARAIDLCQQSNGVGHWGVVSARFLKADGTGSPLADQHAIRPSWGATSVQLGNQLAVLSTANAATPSQSNPDYSPFQSTILGTSSNFPPDWFLAHNSELPNAPGCPPPLAGGAHDPIELELKIRVPTNAESFSLKTNFMSAEFPEYVCTEYNDFFVVLLDSTFAGTPANPTDKNLAFYKDATDQIYPVGVNLANGNTGLFTVCKNGTTGCTDVYESSINTCTSNADLVGTGFDLADPGCDGNDQVGGGTGWLTTSGNVVPGEQITLRIAIWDTSDGQYDSAALIDAFQWSLDPSDPGTIIVN
jgi:hypothetical protein